MNLQQIYLEIVRKYFAHLQDIPVCKVSQGQLKDKRRAIVFGTYNARKNEVRIHPILLEDNTPQLALEFVIYHELLHFEDRPYLLRRNKGEGVHTKGFHDREKLFPYYKEAKSALTKLFKGIPQDGVSPPEKPRKTPKAPALKGEALSQALQASLSRLDETLGRYGLSGQPAAAMKKQKKGAPHA